MVSMVSTVSSSRLSCRQRFGVEALGGEGVTALGYTFVWAGELRIFLMAACANALKIAEQHVVAGVYCCGAFWWRFW